MNDVFISYSRRDKVFTQKLYEALKAVDRIVWADWDSIPAASDWDAEIKQGIQETNSVLFVLSPEWIKSNECRKELVHAVQMGKRLFPILYLPVDPNDVPPELAKINWVYMRDTDDFDKAFQTLCSAMDTDLDWIKTHTRIQVRALEWDRKKRDHSFVLRGNDLTEGEQFIAGAANKSPVPTTLQSEYILASRKDATRRQRQTLAGVTVALVVSIVLGVLAFFQRQAAIRQAQVSRVGELAAQSVSLRENNFLLSLLLGVEAYKHTGGLFDSVQAQSALLDNTQANPQLERFLTGNTVAFSPNGKRVAFGNGNNITLWDVEAHQIIGQPLKGFPGNVYEIAFSPDGKILASMNDDGSLILWDVASQQRIGQPLIVHSGSVNSVAFSPDSKMLAAGGNDDNTIILWDVASRQPIGQPLSGHSSYINSMAFSPDGKILASGSYDTTVILWNIATHQPVGQLMSEYSKPVSSVAFSPDGKTLASGGEEGILLLWDIATEQPIGQPLPLSGQSSYLSSISFSPDGKTLAAGSQYDLPGGVENIVILLWDVASHQLKGQPLSGHSDSITSIAFSPNGKTLASASLDKTAILWDLAAHQTIGQSLVGFSSSTSSNVWIWSVAFSPNGKILASSSGMPGSGGVDNTITLWDVASRQLIDQSLSGHSSFVSSVAFSPDGKMLASGSEDKTILMWDVESHKPIGKPLSGHSGSINSVAFSSDGKMLASGSADKTILIWDVESHKPIGQPLSRHSDSVNSVAFSSDGKTLASGSADGTIILWDVASHQPIGQPLNRHSNSVNSVAFSPDGEILASGSADGTIILWDVVTYQPIGQPLIGHLTSVMSVAFSSDGKTLASGSADTYVILWDVATRQPIGQPLSGHSWIVKSVIFSPNGKTLASGSADNVIILWDLNPRSWIDKSCQQAGRNFTRVEWAKYFPNEDYRKTCEQWPLEPEVTATPTISP